MIIAQAASEYVGLSVARAVNSVVVTVDGFIAQMEPSSWMWVVLTLLAAWFVFRAR